MKTKEEIIEPFIWKDNSGNPRIAIMDCLNAMEIYADQFKQSHIQVVGGPASASVSEGEQLGNEAGAKGVSDGHKHDFKYTECRYRFKCSCGKYEDE